MSATVPAFLRSESLVRRAASAHNLHALEPEVLEAISIAFEDVWRRLVESGSSFAADDQAKATQEVLGLRLIDMARMGENDPVRLRDDALKYLHGANVRSFW
jgi:hypothetical protein